MFVILDGYDFRAYRNPTRKRETIAKLLSTLVPRLRVGL